MSDLFESILDSKYKDSEVLLLVTIIRKAKRESVSSLKPGSTFTSFYKLMSIREHFTISFIRTSIKKFIQDGLIEIRTSYKGTTITFIDREISGFLNKRLNKARG